jgi:hypothetical protein
MTENRNQLTSECKILFDIAIQQSWLTLKDFVNGKYFLKEPKLLFCSPCEAWVQSRPNFCSQYVKTFPPALLQLLEISFHSNLLLVVAGLSPFVVRQSPAPVPTSSLKAWTFSNGNKVKAIFLRLLSQMPCSVSSILNFRGEAKIEGNE